MIEPGKVNGKTQVVSQSDIDQLLKLACLKRTRNLVLPVGILHTCKFGTNVVDGSYNVLEGDSLAAELDFGLFFLCSQEF